MAKGMFINIIILVCYLMMGMGEAALQWQKPEQQPTVYEVLASYGFPVGLLPPTVEDDGEDYTLDADGAFVLHLESACTFTIPGSYEVRYASRISGTVSYDRIRDLRGISVHVLLIWWRINAVSVSGSDLTFHVGPFSASFPAQNFNNNTFCITHVDDGKPYTTSTS